MDKVKKIVIHWAADPHGTPASDWEYFNSINADTFPKRRYGGIHEAIDINGNVLRLIPKDEVAIHCGNTRVNYTSMCINELLINHSSPNFSTYSITTYHNDWTGKPTDEVYNSLKLRLIELCKEFNLDPCTDIVIHNDIVKYPAKDCHRWYRLNPKCLHALKHAVALELGDNNGCN